MDLSIAQHLQPVFQPSQEPVRLGERGAGLLLDLVRVDQQRECRQQAALAQLGFSPAADQLQRLHQELDLADAARPALDVVGQLLARDLGGDRRLHRAQAVERAEVEVAAVDERPQHVEEAAAGVEVAGHGPRLLPCIALPVAPFVLEVLLHRGE